MPGLSRRSELIPFSPIRTMFRLAEEMERAGGGPVYKLHVGDPDFSPPPAVVEAACDAMRAGKTHYEQTAGLHELRAAYAGIRPGYHQDKRHWNSVDLDGSVEDDVVRGLVDDSYDLVVAKLPKGVREGLSRESR